eukprot:COSAG02_NODE_44499_length_365_cov_1.624060_1_plen_65_part_10
MVSTSVEGSDRRGLQDVRERAPLWEVSCIDLQLALKHVSKACRKSMQDTSHNNFWNRALAGAIGI